MTARGNSSHVGSCLSVADILAVLYQDVLRVDPGRPDWPQRDRVILSKGHAGAALYAVLAESGFFPPSTLDQHYSDGSYLCGHVSHLGVPGVDVSTGSLGHGLALGVGMALHGAKQEEPWRVYAVLSDGECDEGSIWEAALFAGHHRLSNLVAVVDYNGIQSLARVEETLDLEPFAEKWTAFGWDVATVDGHDHDQLRAALDASPQQSNRPGCVLAHTIKGKGVSFMENEVLWHYRAPDEQELNAALAELDVP
jgi:transketolase